jgi:hypothetical protein
VRYLKNLSSVSTFEGIPWEFDRAPAVPPMCLTDKAARTVWANDPKTDFQFYSGFVAVNENGRVSDKAGSEEGNPPREMHAAVMDYDAKFTEQEIDSAIARMAIKPNWVERSLSGNARLVWLFERPIILPSQNFTTFLLQHLSELLPIGELSNLDKPAAESASRYYANGCNWRRLHDIPVGWARITGWLLKLSERYSWKDCEPGVRIDPAHIAEEFKKRSAQYPRFAAWPGDFQIGAQGPSFWIEGSTSPLSAIVRENGMQTFAGHATKGFYTWADLFGAAWVKAFEENRIGRAVMDIYFDGHDYAVRNESGRWDVENKDGITNELVVMRGLTRDVSKKKGQTFSEVEGAFAYIRQQQRVKGMASFAFFPKGRMKFNGDDYLNIHTKDAMKPAMEPAVWGAGGQFPWLSAYYDRYFATPNQLPYYLSWGSLFYRGCYYRKLAPGHSIITAGPVCSGKTLSSRGILAPMVGGFAEAKEFLLGEDTFNSELFDYALLVVDDASIAANAATLRRYTESIKRITANQEIRSNEKFRKAVTIASNARLAVTCNQDAESALAIPDMDLSTKDKVMLFRTQEPKEKFPPPEELSKILGEELPWFCRYLHDWEIPAECRSERPEDSRFGGITPYHDPQLVTTASQSSRTASLSEILDVWCREYFTKREPDADVWRGTVLDLYQAIMVDPGMTELMRQFPLDLMKRNLATLSNGTQFNIKILEGDPKRRVYEINRNTHYPKTNGKAVHEVQQTNGSKFQL